MKLHTLKPAADAGPEQHLGAKGEVYLQGQHKDSKSRSAPSGLQEATARLLECVNIPRGDLSQENVNTLPWTGLHQEKKMLETWNLALVKQWVQI